MKIDPRGRHTTISVEAADAIIGGVKRGLSFQAACNQAKVSPWTGRAWLHKGQKAVQRLREGDEQIDPREMSRMDFALRVAEAETEIEQRAVGTVVELMQQMEDPHVALKAATWWLERRRADVFGKRQQLPAPEPQDATYEAEIARQEAKEQEAADNKRLTEAYNAPERLRAMGKAAIQLGMLVYDPEAGKYVPAEDMPRSRYGPPAYGPAPGSRPQQAPPDKQEVVVAALVAALAGWPDDWRDREETIGAVRLATGCVAADVKQAASRLGIEEQYETMRGATEQYSWRIPERPRQDEPDPEAPSEPPRPVQLSSYPRGTGDSINRRRA